MIERIGRGWGIVKASWSVLQLHPKLLLLPILSGAAFLLLIGSIAVSVYAGADSQSAHRFFDLIDRVQFDQPVAYALLFAFCLVCMFIAILFNAALVFCALEAFAGRAPSLRGGLATAAGRLPQILGWALVSATVGLLLNLVQQTLRDRLGFLGSLLGGLLEFAWAVVTFFVVPVLVVDGVGPIEAVKRSSGILKRTWGESLTGEGGLGIISFLLLLPVVILYILALSVVFGALGAIFRTGTYIYATTGQAPSAFDGALLQGAYRSKKA